MHVIGCITHISDILSDALKIVFPRALSTRESAKREAGSCFSPGKNTQDARAQHLHMKTRIQLPQWNYCGI